MKSHSRRFTHRSEIANAAFAAPVPKELMDYLVKNKEKLVPELKALWGKNGFKLPATGKMSLEEENNAMSFYGMELCPLRYAVTVAGKKEYLFHVCNAWLDQNAAQLPAGSRAAGRWRMCSIYACGAPAV